MGGVEGSGGVWSASGVFVGGWWGALGRLWIGKWIIDLGALVALWRGYGHSRRGVLTWR